MRKGTFWAYANSKDPDQPAVSDSLIRDFIYTCKSVHSTLLSDSVSVQ